MFVIFIKNDVWRNTFLFIQGKRGIGTFTISVTIKILFLHQGDVCNSQLLNHIFNTENIDVIFHLAAKTHVGE